VAGRLGSPVRPGQRHARPPADDGSGQTSTGSQPVNSSPGRAPTPSTRTSRRACACGLMGRTYARWTGAHSAAHSATCHWEVSCSPGPSGTTSPTAGPNLATPRWRLLLRGWRPRPCQPGHVIMIERCHRCRASHGLHPRTLGFLQHLVAPALRRFVDSRWQDSPDCG
jgi:hypothetical protein